MEKCKKSITDKDCFDELFECWKNEHEKDGLKDIDKDYFQKSDGLIPKAIRKELGIDYNHSFIKDGIICQSLYEKAECKVLFVTHEARLEDYSKKTKNQKDPCVSCQEEDYMDKYADSRECFLCYKEKNRGDWWSGRMRTYLSRYAGIIYSECNGKDLEDGIQNNINPLDYADKFAFMNLNKRGGDSNIDVKYFKEYCCKYSSFIQKEIELINPDIIAWCGYSSFNICSEVWNNEDGCGMLIEGDNNFNYRLHIGDKSIPIIKLYHTSARRNKYKQLIEILNNHDFISKRR